MSLVCCPLTKPGVTFAVVRSLHQDDGDDDTLFFPNPAINWIGFVRHYQELQFTDLVMYIGVQAPLLKHFQVGMHLCGRPMLVFWVLAQILLRRRVIPLEMSIPSNILNLCPSSVSRFERFVCLNLTFFCIVSVDFLSPPNSSQVMLLRPVVLDIFSTIYPHCVHVCDSLLLTSLGVPSRPK